VRAATSSSFVFSAARLRYIDSARREPRRRIKEDFTGENCNHDCDMPALGWADDVEDLDSPLILLAQLCPMI